MAWMPYPMTYIEDVTIDAPHCTLVVIGRISSTHPIIFKVNTLVLTNDIIAPNLTIEANLVISTHPNVLRDASCKAPVIITEMPVALEKIGALGIKVIQSSTDGIYSFTPTNKHVAVIMPKGNPPAPLEDVLAPSE
jgi:hypothetical protein